MSRSDSAVRLGRPRLLRELRWSYLPPLMVYVAAGISGLTAIVGTFFVKEYLGLSAQFLAGLAFCAPAVAAELPALRADIAALTVAQVSSLTATQLTALSATQIGAFTSVQLGTKTTTQLAAIGM